MAEPQSPESDQIARSPLMDRPHIPRPSLTLGAFVGLVLSAALVLPTAGGLHVVDGDTVDLGYRVELVRNRYRLAGMDAPEIRSARCASEKEAGKRAMAVLEAAVSSEPSAIRPVKRRDKYSRRVAVLALSGEDVAKRAEREGWARAYDGRSRRGSWCD